MYVEAVPSGWEVNGILSWPTSGNIERFRSNANSLPGLRKLDYLSMCGDVGS
uniref:Uncharacterized protein n=1 Tax=Phlebotomus papatasi TaxID=29031 RepID=A0A1B0D148_PHLPP